MSDEQPSITASSIDDLKKVMLALPRMPKTIVDDTRHEKVLSYTSAFISQSNSELYQTMLGQWNILRVLQECTVADQDHRVSGVALRILGVMLEYDPSRNANTVVWRQLETRYPSLLEFLIQSNTSNEALLRYSSWAALQHIVRYARGAQWIHDTTKCPSMVRNAFKDSSNFVIVEACHFLVALINSSQLSSSPSSTGVAFLDENAGPHEHLLHSLLDQVPLCLLVQEMVSNQASERDRLNGLEFLWMVTAARSPQGLAFLKHYKLLHDITTLLMDDSRLVRARALDVLAIVLDTASDPLALITRCNVEQQYQISEALKACTEYLLDDVVLSLLIQTHQLKAWHVAVGVLDAMVQPLCRSDSQDLRLSSIATILSTLLWILQAFQDPHNNKVSIVVEGNKHGRLVHELNAQQHLHQAVRDVQRNKRDRNNSKSNSNGNGGGTRVLPKTVVLSALRAVQNVARLAPESVEHSNLALECVLQILFNDTLCSDQRVFKTCLGTLPILLKAKVRDGHLMDRTLFSKAMAAILDLIKRQEGSSTPLKLILEAVQEFFVDQGLGRVLVQEEIGQQLAHRLQAKLYDMEWDVRDTVVEFIGGLFAVKVDKEQEINQQETPSSSSHGVEWAIKYNMLESLFQKLTDEESYVRAASVHSFEQVMRHKRGWLSMSDPTVRLEERLSGQLPNLIRDSEAFVRRAVLDAMICLVQEREAGTVLLVNDNTDLFVDAKFMSRLALDDADWEVRIRACRFLAAVWDHCRLLNSQDNVYNGARIAKRAKSNDPSSDTAIMTSNWWFYDIKGNQILIEATRDESRMVRAQSITVVKMIKQQIEQATPPEELAAFLRSGEKAETEEASRHEGEYFAASSRKRGQEGESTLSAHESDHKQQHPHPHAAFYRALCALDFVRLDATASVEQLYEEVLNVERVEDVVMEESENPNDGNNILDCY